MKALQVTSIHKIYAQIKAPKYLVNTPRNKQVSSIYVALKRNA